MKNPETKHFEVIKQRKFENNISIYYKLESTEDSILVYQTFGGNDIYTYDENLNLIKKRESRKGKGPGEFNWLCNISYFDGKLYCCDGSKNTVEIFSDEFEYLDTIKIKGNYRMYSGQTDLKKIGNYLYISPTFPSVIIKLDLKDSGVKNKVKSKEEEMTRMGMYNIGHFDCDKEFVYYIAKGREDIYTIEKYDKNLKRVWKREYNDGMVKKLSLKIVKFKNRFEANGAPPSSSLIVDDSNIYNLRGVGGYKEWLVKDNKLTYENKEIKGLENGFVDVFDKTTGDFKYRIEGDFLKTDNDYMMKKKGDYFYFISYYKENKENKPKAGTNVLYKAKIVD